MSCHLNLWGHKADSSIPLQIGILLITSSLLFIGGCRADVETNHHRLRHHHPHHHPQSHRGIIEEVAKTTTTASIDRGHEKPIKRAVHFRHEKKTHHHHRPDRVISNKSDESEGPFTLAGDRYNSKVLEAINAFRSTRDPLKSAKAGNTIDDAVKGKVVSAATTGLKDVDNKQAGRPYYINPFSKSQSSHYATASSHKRSHESSLRSISKPQPSSNSRGGEDAVTSPVDAERPPLTAVLAAAPSIDEGTRMAGAHEPQKEYKKRTDNVESSDEMRPGSGHKEQRRRSGQNDANGPRDGDNVMKVIIPRLGPENNSLDGQGKLEEEEKEEPHLNGTTTAAAEDDQRQGEEEDEDDDDNYYDEDDDEAGDDDQADDNGLAINTGSSHKGSGRLQLHKKMLRTTTLATTTTSSTTTTTARPEVTTYRSRSLTWPRNQQQQQQQKAQHHHHNKPQHRNRFNQHSTKGHGETWAAAVATEKPHHHHALSWQSPTQRAAVLSSSGNNKPKMKSYYYTNGGGGGDMHLRTTSDEYTDDEPQSDDQQPVGRYPQNPPGQRNSQYYSRTATRRTNDNIRPEHNSQSNHRNHPGHHHHSRQQPAAGGGGGGNRSRFHSQAATHGDPLSNSAESKLAPGTLTEHKFRTLGTPEAVHQSRQEYLEQQRRNKVRALQHERRVNREAQCRWPRPKTIAVPTDDPSKTYTPHCTILHRCGADTGCCNLDNQMCVVKHQQRVELYFIVSTVGSDLETYEKRMFDNHTECECVDRQRGIQNSQMDLEPNPLLSCNCPAYYSSKIAEDGSCQCDCDHHNENCRQLKFGLESFSITDRKCVAGSRCTMPLCEYGTYILGHGRCPKLQEKMQSAGLR